MDNTTNQLLKVDNCDIDSEIWNIPLSDHGWIANDTDKKEH